MNIHAIRQDMKLKSIYDIPMRVTFYARVSSEKDEQLNSLDNQIAYYTNLIKENKNWEYVKDLDVSDTVKAYYACNIELDRNILLYKI